MSPDQIRDVFDYRDGALYWKVSPGRRVRAGALAGSVQACGTPGFTTSNKIHVIRYQGHVYTRASLVWTLFNGEALRPVQHRDGNTLNDDINNLTTDYCPRTKPFKKRRKLHSMTGGS